MDVTSTPMLDVFAVRRGEGAGMTKLRGEWSVRQVVRATGTTRRTLRHYDEIGLLPPSRVGANGYRYYDEAALLRLQRILLLRELGLGLPAIRDLLEGRTHPSRALHTHLEILEAERERLARRIRSVRTTLDKIGRGEPLMAEEMFDGFDHTRYEEEVVERWGREAYDRSDAWWRSLSERERSRFGQDQVGIARDFAAAMKAGLSPASDEAQTIAHRQYGWITRAWQGRAPTAETFTGLGEMYVADPRFTRTYDAHGAGNAVFVRDTMKVYAETKLG